MRGDHAARHWLDARVVIILVTILAVMGGAVYATVDALRGDRTSASLGPLSQPTAQQGPIRTPASPATTAPAPSTTSGARATASAPPPAPSATRATQSVTHHATLGVPGTREPAPPPVESGTQGQRAHVRVMTNRQRRDSGLGQLAMNGELQAAAQKYAEHLAADGELSHIDGSQLRDRVTAAGYQWSTVGENLGLGQRTPAEVVAAWMASPGHRANMLNPDFVDIGVGIATRPDGQIVWCVDFGAPK